MTPAAPPRRIPRQDLGSGVYSLAELRGFLGYYGGAEAAERALPWLTHALNPVEHESRQPDYSFADLISLFVVRELTRRGVLMHRIQAAEAYLRKLWNTDRPFVSDEIQTDGHHVYWDEQPLADSIEVADVHGQRTFLQLVKDQLRHVHYHEGTAVYWTPARYVLVDPRVQFGEPVVEGTRVTTDLLAEAVRRYGLDKTARRFDVAKHAVRSAANFEQQLAAFRN